MKIIIIVFNLLFLTNCFAQNDEFKSFEKIKGDVIDTVLEKAWKGFMFDESAPKSFYDRIRLIDLDNKFGEYDNYYMGEYFHYYKGISISMRNKMPLNFNSGAYRDVVFNQVKLNNDILSLKVFFCQYSSGNFRPCFFGSFTFKIHKDKIEVLESNIENLDDWTGYIDGW